LSLFNIFAKQVKACALDFGSTWSKLVKLRPGKKFPALQKVGRLKWNDSDLNSLENTAERLKSLWQSLALKDKSVISSMAGHAVITKRIDIQFKDSKKLPEIIKQQAKQHIPFDIKDVYLDYQIMGPGDEKDTQNVLLVASKKKMVQELQNVLHVAGLGTKVIDVDGFALSNCFEHNYPEELQQTNYLLDIGGIHSIFCVYSKEQPIFVRDIGFGGQNVNERLAKHLNEQPANMESIKIRGPRKIEAAKEDQEKIIQELGNLFALWAEEIQRLINFYQSTLDSPVKPAGMYLAGGGSLISGLKQSLANHLDLDVIYLDPWRRIEKDEYKFDNAYLKSIGPQFAVAAGLALRSIYT
jgi:type IV pilus assembly protein PilM